MLIDTSFDFRVDARGKDPDSHSPTLRKYHKRLWSRPLPGGVPFELRDTTPGVYLHHRSGLGEFQLSSDAVIATFIGTRPRPGLSSRSPWRSTMSSTGSSTRWAA